MPKFSLFPHAAMVLLASALTAAPFYAHAEEGDNSSSVRSTVPNAQLQKELAILQFKPEAASPACIDSLKELHKTQAQLQEEQTRTEDQDLAIAQDVLESDFENSIELCSPDVRQLCESPNPAKALAQACERLGSVPDGPASSSAAD
ncbi:hypothetical protein [Acetobacter orleanensis]|uniref:Secreted protein n=1 Tax=Acetobacter orleanensis TaxID=104099 RepID=A0A4Y3TL69_9PROT|nr:hypothetical protein [Acetobacter orleanensis]GAN67667.1 hypothetical protein Abol_009_113 [Acetobacter orleanensis JCM 7639]GBR25057.1 hypothetical protein AA0473_0797 [Acetobacter orleanensis NRIC 0473]GEB82473.1 hypothetical protein AOR01nite_09500 [Acetobacter orleanensis]